MLLALLGLAAWSAPRAVLGPDGPRWLGPLPPGARDDLVVVVDPWTGALDLEGADDGDPADPSIVRDAVGRPTALVWPDGTWILPRYDEQGRVVVIDGPGRERWRYAWAEDLTVLDPLGRSTIIHREARPEGGEQLLVQDADGRVARTWYGPDGHSVDAYEDPRGLRTTLRRDGAHLRVEDAVGRAWNLLLDERGGLLEAGLPTGGLWRWERDDQGHVARITDPAGRVTRWDRDAEERVIAVVRGGEPWRLERDAQGRLISVEDPQGERVQLHRDDRGRVVTLVDAAGDELRLGRGAADWPTTLLERTGGKWAIDLDLLGRPAGLLGPDGLRVHLGRDGAGQLDELHDDHGRSVRLRWGSSGLLSRVEDSRGRAVSLPRDALGRLAGVRADDGAELRIQRDLTGNITRVSAGDEVFEVRRDPLGLPVAAGDVVWRRDGGERVVGVQAPGLDWSLERDSAGALRRLRTGDKDIVIYRDALGLPVRWSGSEGDVELIRDPAGRPRLERGAVEVALERDARGLVTRAALGDQEWRWLRDASGRPLKISGPRGLTAGVDWDEAGRLTLLRGPDGSMARWLWDGAVAVESWLDLNGVALAGGAAGCEGAWVPDGPDAWRWEGDGGCASPLRPWGLPGDRLALSRGEDGAVARVVGPEGSLSLRRDSLGRLVALVPDDGAPGWRFRYDARGRLAAVGTPAGDVVPLHWSPEGRIWPSEQEDPQVLLATGATAGRAWLTGPLGLIGAAEQGWTATLLPDTGGSPAWVTLSGSPPRAVRTSMDGLPDGDAAGIAGARGAVQAFAGGPLFAAVGERGWSGAGQVAIDPLGGQRLDARGRWPWGEVSDQDRLDPELWAPDTSWHAPLTILVALGALPPLDDGAWTPVALPEPALPWLPASLDGEPPPLGPTLDALPLEDDPLTRALVVALLRGGSGLDDALVLRVELDEAFSAPRLPPGLRLPSLRE